MFNLTEWISNNRNQFSAIVVAVTVLAFTLFNPGWWGDRALGVLIGVASLAIVLMISRVKLVSTIGASVPRTKLQVEMALPWILVAVPIVTALILRAAAGYKLIWPIQFKTPAVPQPQSLFLILIAILMVVLLIVFVRALHRGEGVAIESHWGGLGGGIGGLRLSTPLIYLFGIVFLLVVMAAMAWRIFPALQGQQVTTSTTSPPPSPSSVEASPNATAARPPGNP